MMKNLLEKQALLYTSLLGIIASVICVSAIAWAVWQSKRETGDFIEEEVKP